MNRCIILVTLIVMALSARATAAITALEGRAETTYQLENEPLKDFLRDFLSDHGLRAVLSPQLNNESRRLAGTRSGTPNEIFSSILASNGLMAYEDGLSVYIYLAEESRREFVMIPPEKIVLLQRSLRRMTLDDEESFTRTDPATGVVEIVGAPRYVEQVMRLANIVLDRPADAASHEMVFHYFPLKYAWATDRSFNVGIREVTVAGVASVLQQVLMGGTVPSKQPVLMSNSVKRLSDESSSSGPLQQYSLDPETEHSANPPLRRPTERSSEDMSADGTLALAEQVPAIVASGQQNAIIVRDYAHRIPLYKDLIASLDTPSQIVEIEATIIDVNTDKLRNLGIDWRFSSNESNGEVMFGRDTVKQNLVETLAGTNVSVLDQIPGFQIGAIIGDENQFIARINALQEEGVVSVASRPKVVTLNDLEAVIESSTSFYIPVSGAYEVDLFQVLTGTMLRVTPHLIEHDWGKQIRLIVGIEDGSVTGFNDGTPVTTRHAVTTQALVNTGHSLLLGGLVRDEQQESEFKVPWLGDIPLLGALFTVESKSNGQSERLFLITPRIVAPDGSDQSDTDRISHRRPKPDKDCKGDCIDEFNDEYALMF